MDVKNDLEFLRSKLAKHEERVSLRYSVYDMKHRERVDSLTIPKEVKAQYLATLGRCGKAVDCLADRLVFRRFADDDFGLDEIFQMNNPDVFFDSAILNALIASCCFVYISMGEEGFPRLQVIEANWATGVIDPITGLLKEGYAVLERDKDGRPLTEALFLPGETFIVKGKAVRSFKYPVAYPLLVPIVHRPDAVRPFGRSRISRSSMYWQEFAKRTLERADVTAEFYSFPQKYITGLSQDAEPMEAWRATVSSMLAFTKDAEGDSPSLGQFSVPSMSPFTEQLRMAAAGFAGETGLTLDDLGFVSENPSSAEAIKASHETLRVAAKKAQRSFSSGLLNVGYLACCLRDGIPYLRSQFYRVKPKWEPVFEADASTLSLIGDGAIKINQAIPGYMDGENIRDMTGVEGGSGE